VQVRKRSGRETHLIVELDEGKNREIRRLCLAVGHEVTALKRVSFGPLALGDLKPGEWRDVLPAELGPIAGSSAPRTRR
jgi:pseudouridine synthase